MRGYPTIGLLLLLGACAMQPSPQGDTAAPRSPQATPTPSPTVSTQAAGFDLPARPGWDGVCAGIGIEAELHGDPADPRVTWVQERGQRVEIEWPPGYTAQFTPELVVLNENGDVVAVEGDQTTSVCVGGPSAGEIWLPIFGEEG